MAYKAVLRKLIYMGTVRKHNNGNNLGEINLGEKEVDLLICMDSNSKHINFRKLWTLRNSKRSRCYTLDQLHEYIRKSDITKLNHILINIGCNDIDKKSGEEVFLEIQENVKLLRTKYPNIKIILCEVTPRKDERDQQVMECNRLIHEYASKDENIFIADHSNLRENSYAMLKDTKHVSEYKIGMFVVNIKKALCAAYGKPYIGRRRNEEYSTNNAYGQNFNPNRDINSRLMDIAHPTTYRNSNAREEYDPRVTWKMYDAIDQLFPSYS